jgi:uncharacterized paraquat-inducible protein A
MIPTRTFARPKMLFMAENFSNAMNEWRKAGFKIVTNEQFESRHTICKGCEFYKAEAFLNTGQCVKCGCSIRAKLRLTTSKCPIDKWGPENYS